MNSIFKKLIFTSVVTALAIVSLGQGCGKQAFSYDEKYDQGKYSLGAGGEGYSCVPGQRLGIWLDKDGSGLQTQENYLGFIIAYSGTKSSAANYNYYSASAHPVIGPIPNGFKTNVFFYDGSDGLAINFISNIDTAGSVDNVVNIDVKTSNNSNQDKVLLSDDSGEMSLVNQLADGRYYQGRFHYYSNTDGAVLGPFSGTKFKIDVKFLATGDIQDARFYSANGYAFDLKDSENRFSSFIVAYQDYETCL